MLEGFTAKKDLWSEETYNVDGVSEEGNDEVSSGALVNHFYRFSQQDQDFVLRIGHFVVADLQLVGVDSLGC